MKQFKHLVAGAVVLTSLGCGDGNDWTTCYVLNTGKHNLSSNRETIVYRLAGPATVQYRWLTFEEVTDPPTVVRHEVVLALAPGEGVECQKDLAPPMTVDSPPSAPPAVP